MKGPPRATLPRWARLSGAAQFTGTFKQRFQSPLFTLLVRENSATRQPRLGIVAGRRNASRAVDRSKLRRVIREEFRQCRQQLPGVDLIVRLRAPLPSGAYRQAHIELRELLRRIRI